MKIDYTSNYVTLDWDKISLQEALVRFININESPNTRRATLSLSPRKGFHVRVWLHHPVIVAKYRFNFGDDPRRLLHDLFNRPDHIHDILWARKTIAGIPFKAVTLFEKESS